ncbi:CD48 antigen-like [Nelusetta ayraudi]|uniref:CD48 antigen-like n=1 Tax=Nelusetta ayraudi TaxID=303726 RepID=UPI003F707E64
MDTVGLLHLLLEVLVVLALTMSQVSAQNDINVAVGDDLILELDPKQETLERVVWKHGANLLAEMTLGEFSYYGSFKGHTVLEDSGRLTVSNINQTEGGIYEVEVNNVIQDKRYNVRVFEKLGRPTIRVTPLTCGPGSEDCTLVCDLDVEPSQDVSYEWQLAGEESRIPGKNLISDQTTKATNFTCWAKNPVSEEASESQKNPLISSPTPTVENNTLGILIGGVLIGIGLICVAVLIYV